MARSVRKVIADAIKKEHEARKLYLSAKRKAGDPAAKRLLDSLARQEARHAAVLRGKRVSQFLASDPPAIQDLRITEFLVPTKLTPQSSFQEVLIYAMKREESSFWLYHALSEAASNKRTRNLFRRLAEDERLHRNRLEKLYDDVIYRED